MRNPSWKEVGAGTANGCLFTIVWVIAILIIAIIAGSIELAVTGG